MANYLITGAAGFIGSSLARKYINQGDRVTTIDNLSTGYKSNIPKGVHFIEGDCSDNKIISKNERQVSKALRKSCVAQRNINKGDIIKETDITFKRPGIGISPTLFKIIIGKKAKKNIKKDKLMLKHMF